MSATIPWLRSPSTSRPRVLVVDDDREVAVSIQRLFQALEIEVNVALRSSSVVSLVEKFMPDLVIADVIMPGLDGGDLVKLIRADATLRATPVLLFSGLEASSLAAVAQNCGANGYVAKAEGVLVLRNLVVEFLGRVKNISRRLEQESAG